MDAKLFPIVHTICRSASPELAVFQRELRVIGSVYAFASTAEMLAAWQIARANDATEAFTPTAVVWLQSRPGEYRQREIDVIAEHDPLARPIVVAGCLSEGEPRSGRPLTNVSRMYWHQGAAAVAALIARRSAPASTSLWIAIHTRQYVDYQGLAAICQAAGHHTIWQHAAWPVISSEAAVRLFQGWDVWRNWREHGGNTGAGPTKHLLLQDFPRPGDREQAASEGINAVLAQPFTAADLQRALVAARRPVVRITTATATSLASRPRPAQRYLQSA